MAEAGKAGEQDQSMEEILQSIKRIIADEGDAAPAAAPAPFGSDVLELTDIVAEPASPAVDPLDAIFAAAPAPAPASPQSAIDDIFNSPAPAPASPQSAIDDIFSSPAPAPASPQSAIDDIFSSPAPVVEAAVEPEMQPPAPEVPAAVSLTSVDQDTLISQATVEASAAALRALKGAEPHAYTPIGGSQQFRSGNTVEDLVIEALRPMLKEWLDANLPRLVERMVQHEIERITRAVQG